MNAFENDQIVPVTDFDWESVFARLDGEQPHTPERLARLFDWLISPEGVRYFGKAFKLKATALAWVINPGAFGDKSLSDLAAECGVTPQAMSRYAALGSRVFGLRNGYQRAHGGRWKPDQPDR